jgi:hypothetical protein
MSGMVIRRIVTAILAEVLFGDIMKAGLMAVTLVLLVSISGAEQRGTGSVCVAARIDDPFWKEPATLPNGEINSHGVKVRVDTKPVEEWPQRKSLKIDGLDTSERHLYGKRFTGTRPLTVQVEKRLYGGLLCKLT